MAVDNPRNAFPRQCHHHSTAARPSDWSWMDKTLVRRTGLVPTSSSSLCEDAAAGWVGNVPGIALPPSLLRHQRLYVYESSSSGSALAFSQSGKSVSQHPGHLGLALINSCVPKTGNWPAGLRSYHRRVARRGASFGPIVFSTTSETFALQHPRNAVVPEDIGLPRWEDDRRTDDPRRDIASAQKKKQGDRPSERSTDLPRARLSFGQGIAIAPRPINSPAAACWWWEPANHWDGRAA